MGENDVRHSTANDRIYTTAILFSSSLSKRNTYAPTWHARACAQARAQPERLLKGNCFSVVSLREQIFLTLPHYLSP